MFLATAIHFFHFEQIDVRKKVAEFFEAIGPRQKSIFAAGELSASISNAMLFDGFAGTVSFIVPHLLRSGRVHQEPLRRS